MELSVGRLSLWRRPAIAAVLELHGVDAAAVAQPETGHVLAVASVDVGPGAAAVAAGHLRPVDGFIVVELRPCIALLILALVHPVLERVRVRFLAQHALQARIAGQVAGHADVRAALPAFFNAFVEPVLQDAVVILGGALLAHVEVALAVVRGVEFRGTAAPRLEAVILPVGRQIDPGLDQVGLFVVVVIPIEDGGGEAGIGPFAVLLFLAQALEGVAGIVERAHGAAGGGIGRVAGLVLGVIVGLVGGPFGGAFGLLGRCGCGGSLVADLL